MAEEGTRRGQKKNMHRKRQAAGPMEKFEIWWGEGSMEVTGLLNSAGVSTDAPWHWALQTGLNTSSTPSEWLGLLESGSTEQGGNG